MINTYQISVIIIIGDIMRIRVGVSNRHLHLTEADFKELFGNEASLEIDKAINQPGQFASSSRVDVAGPKGTLKGLRVLGPLRKYTQVELSQTDCRTIGITAPVRRSGDLADASEIEIIGPRATIKRKAAIIANRHIHIDRETIDKYGLNLVTKVSLKVGGEKPTILQDVFLKEENPSYFEVHLDTDDANACQIKNGDEVEIII